MIRIRGEKTSICKQNNIGQTSEAALKKHKTDMGPGSIFYQKDTCKECGDWL